MKYCSKCKTSKPVDDFGKNKRTKDQRQRWCKECDRVWKRSWFKENKEKQLARTRKNNIRANLRNQEYVWEYLLNHPCVDCGESNILCLQFDHIDDNKSEEICVMLGKALALSTIEREIKKCVVRCANCHMKITAQRANYARYRWFVQRKDGNLISY